MAPYAFESLLPWCLFFRCVWPPYVEHKMRMLKNVLVTPFYAITVIGDWRFWEPDHSDPWINHFTYSAKWSHLLWMNHSLDSDSLKICKSSPYRSEWFVHNWSASQVQLTDSKWLHFSLFLKKSWLQRAQIAWCIMWTTFMVICSEAWKHSVLFNGIVLKSNESPWL